MTARTTTCPPLPPTYCRGSGAVGCSLASIRRNSGQSCSSPGGRRRIWEPAISGDKRFGAPEWYGNPLYRTLVEAYLLASDWLLKHSEVPDMGDAEQLRFNFHLRQFVDAMSPALQLALNPVALRRAFETG